MKTQIYLVVLIVLVYCDPSFNTKDYKEIRVESIPETVRQMGIMGMVYDNNMDINKIQSIINGYYKMDDDHEVIYLFDVIIGQDNTFYQIRVCVEQKGNKLPNYKGSQKVKTIHQQSNNDSSSSSRMDNIVNDRMNNNMFLNRQREQQLILQEQQQEYEYEQNRTQNSSMVSDLLRLFISQYGEYEPVSPDSISHSLLQFTEQKIQQFVLHQNMTMNHIDQIESEMVIGKLYRMRMRYSSTVDKQHEHIVRAMVYARSDGSYEFINGDIMY